MRGFGQAMRQFLHRLGHGLAWAAIVLLLLQSLGGASFLARLVAPVDDPLAVLAREYLCTARSGSASTDPEDQHQSDDRGALACAHCLLCSAGFPPLLLAVLPLALALRFPLSLSVSRKRFACVTQYRQTAHPSRAPPLPA